MTPVYATVALLHGDHEFEIGDEIQRHHAPEQLEKLIANGHAARERPAGVTPAYAAVDELTYCPQGAVHRFMAGDRIDGPVPAALVRQLVARGEATFDPPAEA